jgi:sulfite reductase (NADPH) flavoprotein alpha-component
MRRLHSIAGLLGSLVVVFMAVTGAILSLQPVLETAAAKAWGGLASTAELAGAVATTLPGVERITHSASGTVVAYYADSAGAQQAARIDPASGAVVGAYEPSPFFTFITELHRSLFMGDLGHAVAGIGSVAIALLAASGIFLLVSRMGGWKKLLTRVRGDASQRLHATLARVALVALVVTSLSGAFMSAVNFGFVPDGISLSFAMLPSSSGDAAAPIDSLTALADVPVSDLRELVFPAVGDTGDVFTLTTSAGVGYIDQSTGEMLKFIANNFWQQLYEAIYILHTGDGVWWLALILGVAALAVPALAITGVMIWAKRQRNGDRLAQNSSWRQASTVILVGTENSSTNGFAASLHAALVAAGERVHTAPMNTVRVYPKAERLLVLTSTYGDGDAPASASHFLSRLARLPAPPARRYGVLGFGDRSFAQYCAFAEATEMALKESGAEAFVGFDTIDRQSSQDFARWGTKLGEALGLPLALVHTPARPASRDLVLVEREDFGCEVQAPTAVLRFKAPEPTSLFGKLGIGGGLPRFKAGDLIGIMPPGSDVPRYYSLASSSRDGTLEICVRKQSGGLCSEFLHGLAPGDRIEGFVRRNPDFRPAGGNRPLILIGAGAGVAPLAGFVRHNRPGRPAYMFFGTRHPRSDYLYEQELATALEDHRLTGLDVAFSRVSGGQYVQQRLAVEGDLLRQLVSAGAQILVCGGLDMAREVRATLDAVLQPLALTTADLKSRGRYLEDAY